MATYSYTAPLLAQIFAKGGIGLTEDDDPLEQAALALDLVKFHCGECKLEYLVYREQVLICGSVSENSFPRKQTLESLLHVIRQQPKLAKDASSALIAIGQAIHATVSPEELSVIIRGTLLQEVYVRNSCLQTLQVR